MRYSIKPRDRIYVQGYRFLSFANKMNNKYGQKLIDTAKRSTTDAIKTASKRATQKTAEATGDLIGNKIAEDVELTTYKKRYISPEERKQIIDELRLVPKKYV